MNNKGYTLIELVVTISLVVVVTAIFVPKLNYNRSYLKAFSDELLYDVRDLRTKSMTKGSANYSIVFDTDKNIYYYKEGTNVIKSVELDSDYEFDLYTSTISFNFNGTPDNAQTIRIRNKKTGDYKEISIVPNTGRILLVEE